jgi:quinoprotein relay system zinc metallohydrolase 2
MLHKFLAVLALPAGAFSSPSPATAEAAFRLGEIAPGVYAHQGETSLMTRENFGGIANLGAIVGDDSVAVIDTGGSLAQGKAFLAALREKTQKPIRYVINTHAHPDHVFGNGAFNLPGVTFVGHKNLPRSLATRGEHYLTAFRQIMGDALEGTTIVGPTLTVSDAKTLELGGREIVLQAWKTAHSEADLTVLDKKSGTLFAGDLLFLQHVPVVDGSLLGFLDVADQLAAIKAERVVPGHGPVTAPWPKALDDERAYLARLTGDLRGAIEKGESVKNAAATAASAERGKWRLFEEYNARNATAGFAELEWEAP